MLEGKQGVTPIELISLVNRITKSNEIEIGSIDIRAILYYF